MGEYQEEFLELLADLDDKDWDLRVNSGLTIKEMVSQLIGWEEEYAVCLMDSWQSGEEPWFLKTEDYSEFNDKAVKKYNQYTLKGLIERLKFVTLVFDSEIEDIGIGRLKVKGKLFDWFFDDSHYEKYSIELKKVLQKHL